jgi:hypothetical protein
MMVDFNALADWERYLLGLPQGIYGDADLEIFREKLASESPRIFSGHGEIEVWQRDRSNSGRNDSPPSRWLF